MEPVLFRSGYWPRWLIPRYWWAWLQMLIWRPSAHVVFTVHVIGEGPTASWKGACARFPWLGFVERMLPKKWMPRIKEMVAPIIQRTPTWLRYAGCAFVQVEEAGVKRRVCVHVLALPFNTLQLADPNHPDYKAAVEEMNANIIWMLRYIVPQATVLALGAATAIPNTMGTKLPALLAAAGLGHVIVSNGNSYTGKAAFHNFCWYHRNWTAVDPNRHGKKWRIGVIGAGSVGGCFSRLCPTQPDMVSEVWVVGRKPGDRKVVDLVSELDGKNGIGFREATHAEILAHCDVVVLATSSAEELDFSGVRPGGTFFLDIAKPANTPRWICKDPRYLAVAGSIVTLPGRGRGFGQCIGLGGFLSYACGAEGVILALCRLDQERWNWLVQGIDPSSVSALFLGNPNDAVALRLGQLADDYGFRQSELWLDPHTNLPVVGVHEYMEADHWLVA